MAYWVSVDPNVGDILVADADEEKQVRADFAANEKKRLADLAKAAKADSSAS